MAIIVAVNLSAEEDSARRVGRALARRLRTEIAIVARDDLLVLAARVREMKPLLVVASHGTRTERQRLCCAVERPVLYVPLATTLDDALDGDGTVRVTLALEHTAKADEPVIRTARLLRSALRCELTLLCGESAAEPVLEALIAGPQFDIAIVGERSVDSAMNEEIDRPMLVVMQIEARAAATADPFLHHVR